MQILGIVLSTVLSLTSTGWEHRVQERVNDVREQYLLPTTSYDACLDDKAEQWARRLANLERLRHRDMGRVLDTCGGVAAGEVLAMGQESPREVVRAWMRSARHYAVLTNPVYTQIGVGAKKTDDGRWVTVVNVGR